MEVKIKSFDELTTTELYEIIKSRNEIFLLEQNIVCQDLDDVDYESFHCFIMEKGRVVAYLRAYSLDEDTIKIGRVLSLEHKKGYGTVLMEKSLQAIRERKPFKKIYVSAQKRAEGFYKKLGFRTTSDEYLEEEIPHVSMEKFI